MLAKSGNFTDLALVSFVLYQIADLALELMNTNIIPSHHITWRKRKQASKASVSKK